MLDLARRAAEVLVERSANLARENAWEGEFREALSEWLTEDPPEQGQPPNEVLERAVSGVLPLTLRHDHPRCFGFVASSPTWPGVVADFLAAGYNINSCNWLVATGTSQLECVVIDWFRRWLGYPETAGGLPTSGGSDASLDFWDRGLQVLARLFWEDPAFVTSAVVAGKFSLRLCIVNHNTGWDDVRETLEAAERFGREALSP